MTYHPHFETAKQKQHEAGREEIKRFLAELAKRKPITGRVLEAVN